MTDPDQAVSAAPNAEAASQPGAGLPVRRSKSAVRGAARLALLALSRNVFSVCAIGLFGLVLRLGQGREVAALTEAWIKSGGDQPWTLVLLVAFFGAVAGMCGVFVGIAGPLELNLLVENYRLPVRVVRIVMEVAVPWLLAVTPPLLFADAVASPDTMPWALVWTVVAAAPLAYVAAVRAGRVTPIRLPPPLSFPPVMPAIVLWVMFIVSDLLATSPESARNVGTPVVIALASTVWVGGLTLVFVWLPLRFGFPNLAVVVPVVWIAATMVGDSYEFPHRDGQQLIPRADQSLAEDRPGLETSFLHWLARVPEPASGTPPDHPIPVYLIAAEGGGIRAAAWTTEALSSLEEHGAAAFSKHAFAYSGVSGGSLGLVGFVLAHSTAATPDEASVSQRLRTYVSLDFLAPVVSRLLLAEPVSVLVQDPRRVSPRDQAFEEQLARDWTKTFGDDRLHARFLDTFRIRAEAPQPAIFLNATNVESGRRVIVSNVSLPGGDPYHDAFYIGEHDVMGSLTTAEAIHLSARFPLISPPASIYQRGDDGRRIFWGRVVDGGYFENSGTVILTETLRVLQNLRLLAMQDDDWSDTLTTGVPLPDWTVLKAKVRRVRFRALVVRNDPSAGSIFDGPEDIPARRAGVPGITPEQIAASAPVRPWFSDVSALVSTTLATRDSRGEASRVTLWNTVIAGNALLQARCRDQGRRTTSGATPSLGNADDCDESPDEFFDLSLHDALVALQQSAQGPDKRQDCADPPRVAEVPLGWALSSASVHLLRCAAGTLPIEQILGQPRTP